MSTPTKDSAYTTIASLVERFEQQYDSYKNAEYNEAMTRRDFIDPFFKALGWDMDNESGYAESYREVIHEDKLKVGKATKAPDYSFRIGGKRLFFVEAKKPSIFIKDDVVPAYQVRRYGWSAKLPISIVTDFEEFAVYDCTQKPHPADKAATARIRYLTFRDYLKEFDFLWSTFGKEAVLKGSFDRFVQSDTNKKGTTTVDESFLQSLDGWRIELAKNIALRNENLNDETLTFLVQQTIDRIVFLRIAEDRGVEQYGLLKGAMGSTSAQSSSYQNLMNLCRVADQKYNSGLFDFAKDEASLNIAIDSKVMKAIVDELYYPQCPYEFSVLSVEILGSAYERFLGKEIRLTKGGRAVIEEKPEVRKAGGVYYTPQYIVDYIVQHTIGKQAEGKTPQEVSALKVVDPACGSGSFLLGAYQYLLDWHRDYYAQQKMVGKGHKADVLTPLGTLTIAKKKEILLNNIFGVDLDSNAVEVTKLSLLLKCMEGETEASIATQQHLFHDRLLPSLDSNIQCGNSLIDLDYYDAEIDFGEERKVKPFCWEQAFPEVFGRGGFSCVVGNPPYVSIKEINPHVAQYIQTHYGTAKGQIDLFSTFIEKGAALLRSDGMISLIVPDALNDRSNFEPTRKLLITKVYLNSLLTLNNVFDQTNVGSSIFIAVKSRSSKVTLLRTKNGDTFRKNEIEKIACSIGDIESNEHTAFLFIDKTKRKLLEKIYADKAPLQTICYLGRGEEISKKSEEVISRKTKYALPFISGEDFSRYVINPTPKYIHKTNVRKPLLPLYGAKIVVRQVGDNITAALDETGYITPQSVYSVVPNTEKYQKYILALLNSRLFNFIYHTKFKTKELFPRILLENLKTLPIVAIASNNKTAIDKIIHNADLLLQLNNDLQSCGLPEQQNRLKQRIAYTEQKVDEAVFALYELNEEEICLIKN
jgi:type I restriction-modification system DNA methylase subunit